VRATLVDRPAEFAHAWRGQHGRIVQTVIFECKYEPTAMGSRLKLLRGKFGKQIAHACAGFAAYFGAAISITLISGSLGMGSPSPCSDRSAASSRPRQVQLIIQQH
jgi:hypothetical protein